MIMPRKKTLAGSAANSVAQTRTHGSDGCGDFQNNIVAELIEQIEVMFVAEDIARSFRDWTDSAQADMPILGETAVPMARCHASISYIRGHQAWSIDLFWNGASPASSDSAGETTDGRQPAEARSLSKSIFLQ